MKVCQVPSDAEHSSVPSLMLLQRCLVRQRSQVLSRQRVITHGCLPQGIEVDSTPSKVRKVREQVQADRKRRAEEEGRNLAEDAEFVGLLTAAQVAEPLGYVVEGWIPDDGPDQVRHAPPVASFHLQISDHLSSFHMFSCCVWWWCHCP